MSLGSALSCSSSAFSASSSAAVEEEVSAAAGGERGAAMTGEWKRMKKKAVAAMTMAVVSTTGLRNEFRVWRIGGRDVWGFLGVRNAGSFSEEALMEGNLNKEEEGKWSFGRERVE